MALFDIRDLQYLEPCSECTEEGVCLGQCRSATLRLQVLFVVAIHTHGFVFRVRKFKFAFFMLPSKRKWGDISENLKAPQCRMV
jgi:hypothetical protein